MTHNYPWKRPVLGIICACVLFIACSFLALSGSENPDSMISVKILAINDFHGHLYHGQTIHGHQAGSAPVLASYLKSALNESCSDHTVLALVGDIIGASPRQAALLQDEPTVLFFNSLSQGSGEKNQNNQDSECDSISVPGNHEFNQGTEELLRMIHGGNGNITTPSIVDPYPGLHADTICANVVWKENGTPVFPPYTIRHVKGVPVAFIGAVTTETSILELPMNIRSVDFLDESESINRYIRLLQKEGIHAFVILLHEGGMQDPYAGPTIQGGNVSGRIVNITSGLDPDADIVLSAHTHTFTNAYLPNSGGKDVLVVQAYSYGRAYADVDLLIDPKTGEIAQKSAVIVPVYADQGPGNHPDPGTLELLNQVESATRIIDNEVIAVTNSGFSRVPDREGGSELGRLVADSQRKAMGADIAFVTSGSLPGSLHADLPRGRIIRAAIEAVLPPDASMAEEYGGWYSRPRVACRELNGTQIRQILERQWMEPLPEENLSVSGLVYQADLSRPVGDRITDIRIHNRTISGNDTYLAAMNYYLAYGRGDYSPGWDRSVNVTIGPADIDALISYMKTKKP